MDKKNFKNVGILLKFFRLINGEWRVTRKILTEMIESPPDFLQIQTRSPLVVRDLDILSELQQRCELLVSMTIETDREDVKRLFAPLAPGINQRLKALRNVHAAGINTQAAISPLLPFTPDFPKRLQRIVDRIYIDSLNIWRWFKGEAIRAIGYAFVVSAKWVF
ncbi:hypothetical protein [Paenibacillus polymyxa]|uniref:hypothetical protein n=1 Tax=Paenibacillus polymyxa TaxID=1406 RepID=UPI00201D59F0|nr:hypothetical protein [Paenibacillus polymyxa]